VKKLSLSLTFLAVLVFSIMATPQTPFVEAQDFSIDVTPGTQSHYGPGNATYYVTVSSSGGFFQQVVLTATISGGGVGLPTPTVNPPLVRPPPNGVAHAVVVVWIKDPTGYTAYHTITVTGSSGGVYHTYSASLILASDQGEFSLYSYPWSITIHPGQPALYAFKVFPVVSLPGDTVTLYAFGGPTTGATMYFNGTYPSVIVSGFGGVIARNLTFSVATTSAVEPGSYPITISGTGSAVTHYYYVILVIEATGDFTIAASPDTLSVNQGETGSVDITVTSTGGFVSKTNLKWEWVGTKPTGVTPSLSPTSVTPTSGGSKTSKLKIETTSSATVGTFQIMVTGTSYPKVHNVNVTVEIKSIATFGVQASPTSLSIVAGQTGISTITVTSTGGFSSAVSLSFSWVGTYPTGVTPSLSAYSLTPPAGSSATSTLTIATSATTTLGTYVVRITGVSGTLTYSADVTFTVTTPATTTVTTAVTTVTTFATTTAPGRPCIIATATYGSELASEVQFLRSFRDQQVKSTFAGDQFMVAFNAWYYSFSPYIAQFIASNAFAKAVMKVLLYPLIGILHLAAMTYNAFGFSHELAVVMAGLVASALIGVVYFSPLAILALILLRRYRKMTLKMSQLRMLAIVWVASLPMILVGEVALLPALMIASTAVFVLSTLSLGALSVATALLRRIR